MVPEAPERIIIGTAGHVDHGKTVLIRALTGEDTDRLPEEKERGISIDLGFAECLLPSGRQAGIVDVPGHERFIKNMVAGTAGIDLVLLVVAADEGVMPQTREHLAILDLLGVQRGMIVITKKDLVEDEWLVLVEEEIEETVAGTFLEDASIHAVSAKTGDGIETLRTAMDDLVPRIQPKDPTAHARLPVDRVFSVSGFGTVVTGTMVAGSIEIDDQLMIQPHEKSARVRNLQVHGEDVERAAAGQRVAVNLSGVAVDEIGRGDVLAAAESLDPTIGFAGELGLLPDVLDEPLQTGTRVRVHIGTAEVLGRLLLLDREELPAGEQSLIQFKAEDRFVAVPGDRFILRSFSPLKTLGGGRVLDPYRRYRRFNRTDLTYLRRRVGGELDQLLLTVLDQAAPHPLSIHTLVKQSGERREMVEETLQPLIDQAQVLRLNGGVFISRSGFEQAAQQVKAELNRYFDRHPLRQTQPKEEVRQAVWPHEEARWFSALIERLADAGEIEVRENRLALPGRTVELADEDRVWIDRLQTLIAQGGVQPPSQDDLVQAVSQPPDQVAEGLRYLEEEGAVVRVSDDIVFDREVFEQAWDEIREYLKQYETITVSEARDRLESSRKYIVPLMEYLDRTDRTHRIGDTRILKG